MTVRLKPPPEAEEYYDVKKAEEILNSTNVPEGYIIWACVLCGCPNGAFPVNDESIGAYCCVGCGQSCLRPITEYPFEEENGPTL